MRDPGLDGTDRSNSADLQKNTSDIASANALASKDSYTITIEKLPVKLAGKYNFVFQYYYSNPDKSQSTPVLGPPSATYSVELEIPCIATAPTNVQTVGGFYSYQVKWDMPTFSSYADTIVYESNTNSFSSSSKVVYVGTANQCNILTSDLLPKYVYIVHRDMFRQSCIAGFVAGPITIKDPIVVDANPPTNDFTVGTATVQDDPDGLFTFNKKILFNWTANTDTSTYGYQIRFRRVGTTDYTYMSVPGRTVTSTYLYGLKAGQTYEIGVSTYDQFGNTNTSDWKSYPNIVIPPSTSLAADVAITAGDMKMGYGIGGDNANKGLYLGPENYWYITGNTTASSAARLSVGGTNDKLVWDGTNLSVTGNLTARAGSFTGNILLATDNASIYNGTVNADGNLIGNGFALNGTGLKVANGDNSVTLDAASGQITANAGTIAGWQLTTNGLSNNNARINSLTGSIELGGFNTNDIVRLDANDANYRLWIGKNSSVTAPFRVSKAGVLYATGAIIDGDASFSGTLTVGTKYSDGTTLESIKTKANSAITAADLAPLTTRVTNAETAITGKASAGDLSALTSVVGEKAAKAYVDGQLELKASLTALNDKLDANAYSVIDVANKINAIDTSVVTINGGKLTAGSIDTVQIAAGAITAVKIATGTITADQIEAGTITAFEIAGETITAAEIAAGAITADKIEAGTITAGKIAATQTFTGHTIVGNRIATSSSTTRVELINNTTDSLRALISGTTVGHVLGYGTASTGGMIMHAGATANPDVTSGHVRVLPNYAVLAGTSTRYVEATSTQVNISGTTYLGSGGYNVYMVSGDTTASNANLFINSTTGQLARSTSSRRYKTDIETVSYTDSAIKSLRPVKYHGIEDLKRGDSTWYTGLIAEEVAAIPGLELLVNYTPEGIPEAVNYAGLSVVLADVVSRILDRLDALEG